MADWQEDEITIIESAEGSLLRDVKGQTFIDGVSSLWCNVHGHRVPEIDEAIQEQLGKVAHSTFLGLSNVPAIELAEEIIELAPQGLTRVFYSDSGATACEIALKMALQYWQQKGKGEKQKFVKLQHAYHGDTLGAVSVGGIQLFHDIFKPLLFKTYELPAPFLYRWPQQISEEKVLNESLKAMERLFSEKGHEIAAFIMEPLMQGAAGMIQHPKGYLEGARRLTLKYDILLIADEVATGFGRTGALFACEQEDVAPDLMCLAKGISGGYLPLAATLATEEIYQSFLGRYEEFKAFFHGHTYTANPLACAAGRASLKLFKKNAVLEGLKPKIKLIKSYLEKMRTLEHVGDVRQVGMMVGIELVADKRTKQEYDASRKLGYRVTVQARKLGIWIRPLGNVIVLMPPLGISMEHLEKLLQATELAIREVTEKTKEL